MNNEQDWASLLSAAEAEMPYEDYAEVEAPAKEFTQNMATFREGEEIYGSQPETWEAAQPKQEAAVQAIKKMTDAYRNEDTPQEEQQQSKQAAIGSLQDAGDFFKLEYAKMLEKDRQMQEQMEAMRKQIEIMQQMMMNFSPEAVSKCVLAGMQFLKESEATRQEAVQQKNSSLYKAARQAVSDVYQNVVDAPHKIKISIQNKAYETADRAVKHVAGWFDKGIDYLTSKKNAILNMSPLAEKASQEASPDMAQPQDIVTPEYERFKLSALLNPQEADIEDFVAKVKKEGYSFDALAKATSDFKINVMNVGQTQAAVPEVNADEEITIADFMKNSRSVAEKYVGGYMAQKGIHPIPQLSSKLQLAIEDSAKKQFAVPAATNERSM